MGYRLARVVARVKPNFLICYGFCQSDAADPLWVQITQNLGIDLASAALERYHQGMSLKRASKSEQIAADVAESVRLGELRPGNRLAPVKSLCQRYNAGQRTIERALAQLRQQGLIEVRPRSGCYVTDQAVQLAQIAPARSDVPNPNGSHPAGRSSTPCSASDVAHDADDTESPRSSASSYLLPAEPAARRLRLFACTGEDDLDPLWHGALAGFDAAEIELRSFAHVAEPDLFDRYQPDLILGTNVFLARFGAHRFAPVNALGPVDPEWWDQLLPQVAARTRREDRLLGVPALMTQQYLFVNRDLAEQAGVDPEPATPRAFVEAVLKAHRALAGQPAESLFVPGLTDLLWLFGGVYADAVGRLHVDEPRAHELFARLAGSRLPLANEMEVIDRFAAGRVLFLVHCSFEIPLFLQHADFAWRAEPLPVADGVTIPSWLLLLGIHRNSPALDAAAALVRHLTEPAAQQRLATHHGHLPVRRDALHHAPTPGPELSSQTINQTLARSGPGWNEHIHMKLRKHAALAADRRPLLEGELSPAEAVRRLVWCVQLADDPHPVAELAAV